MITITSMECMFCNKGLIDTHYAYLYIESIPIAGFHKVCWAEHTCAESIMKFDSFEEWRKYAGEEWDLTEHVYIDFGTKEWFRRHTLHRLDKPAIECANGTRWWYQNGKRHREGGPAVTQVDGFKQWYLEGVNYSEHEYLVEAKKRGFQASTEMATRNSWYFNDYSL